MGTRLFAAIVPPEDAVEHLDAFLEPRRAAADFRWTIAEHLHVTLAFMPSVSDHLVDEYADRLADGLARTPVPVLQLGGPVAFPDAHRTRVLAASVLPHALLATLNGAVALTLEIEIAEALVLFSVAACTVDAVPTCTWPKSSDVGMVYTALAPVPVPLSATVNGPFERFAFTASVPVRVPFAPGVKLT